MYPDGYGCDGSVYYKFPNLNVWQKAMILELNNAIVRI